jgi:DNA-binding MarR family transcriptional regulator
MSALHTDEAFTILTGKISNAINRTFLRTFTREGIDITTEQWSVLACLWKQDNVTQQTLCNLTGKDKPSMTRLIDNLEKSRLVVRIPDSSDKRTNLIQLTTEGKSIQQKATQLVQTIADTTLQGISIEELDTCRQVLKKIMKNLA